MMLTIKELAAQLKISLSLAYRLVASGEIPSYAIGSCKRIDQSDLAAYLNQQRSRVPTVPKSSRKHF
jgi:excisionase family DNA binding protein